MSYLHLNQEVCMCSHCTQSRSAENIALHATLLYLFFFKFLMSDKAFTSSDTPPVVSCTNTDSDLWTSGGGPSSPCKKSKKYYLNPCTITYRSYIGINFVLYFTIIDSALYRTLQNPFSLQVQQICRFVYGKWNV